MMLSFQFVALVDRVAYECQVTPKEIYGKSRRPHVSDARAIVVYCARKLWACSYPTLGRYIRRSHSQALYLDAKIRNVVDFDDRVATIVDRVMEEAA